ncbi:hypothetical protein EYR41_003650 [Orbilia oligospora]|uniref:Uncharacterized protein n=1 Tax=Orbilia oligospora TaxID=2813651 RepID=A0A8H2HUI6_ORBOL|nr:hypothetical protein EYR41_003650 [Orbilia oligospora]
MVILEMTVAGDGVNQNEDGDEDEDENENENKDGSLGIGNRYNIKEDPWLTTCQTTG